MENLADTPMRLYYQIDYCLTEVPEDAGYFHAQFRRTNPVPYKDVYTIVDGIKGKGHYVGTYMAWQVNNNRWWGEGEIKFFMDGDKQFPTICGTGTEDYFCGSYNFDRGGKYIEFSTPYAGLHQVNQTRRYLSRQTSVSVCTGGILLIRYVLKKDLKVTIQDLGWRADRRYLAQRSDISSVAFWYQQEPHKIFQNYFPRMSWR